MHIYSYNSKQSVKSTDRLRTVKIQKVKIETPTIKSFTFYDEACTKASPGQFVMVWIPGVDEIPMSLSMIRGNYSVITVKKIGEASEALHNLKSGDFVKIRGPYGLGFTIATGNIMVVGGGIGIAPLAPLVKNLAKPPSKITLITGARTYNEILFLERMKQDLSRINAKIIVTTEDGSYGKKGLATDPAEEELAKQKFDTIYTCGPEKMMQKMFLLSEQYSTPLQASLERLIRCSIGLCGSCMIGKFRVCKDGPVFTSFQLRKIKNVFGVYKRDLSGRRIRI